MSGALSLYFYLGAVAHLLFFLSKSHWDRVLKPLATRVDRLEESGVWCGVFDVCRITPHSTVVVYSSLVQSIHIVRQPAEHSEFSRTEAAAGPDDPL